MTIQTVQEVSVRLGEEVTWGVIPATPHLVEIEKVSWAVNLVRDPYVSTRIRSDRQIPDVAFGPRRSEGDYQDELSLHDHDLLMSGAFMGTWTAGVSVVGVSMSAVSASRSYVRAVGSFVTDGFVPGVVVNVTGFVGAANDGHKTIASVTATTLVVVEDLVDEVATVTGIAAVGFILKNGKAKHSFFAEVFKPQYPDHGFERHTGLKVNSCMLTMPPTGIATVKYSFMGRDQILSDVSLDSSVTPPADGSLLVASNGVCTVNGMPSGLVTQLDFTIANNIQGPDAVGLKYKAALIEGKSNVTGSMTVMTENNDLMNAYTTAMTIGVGLRLDGGYTTDFLSFYLPRLYITKATQAVTGDGALMLSIQFQATLSTAHGAAIIAQKSYV